MGNRIFILDDEELILDSFNMIFSDLGYDVVTCDDAKKAIELVLSSEFDLILTDIRMPGMNGAEVIRAVKAKKPETRIFVLTAFTGDPIVQTALEAGAQGVMKKPFEIAKILDLMKAQ